MTSVLNLVTKIKDAETLDVFETETRKFVLYLSYRYDAVIFGYVNDNLVFCCNTKTNDMLSIRRAYDCVKAGSFYHKTSLDTMLDYMGLVVCDLQNMCYIQIDDIISDNPRWSGCFVPNINDICMLSITFAEYIAVLPQRLKDAIKQIGSDDDILAELEADFEFLQKLYGPNEPFDFNKYQQAIAICDKWGRVGCLHMSDRATIRKLYRDVCFHDASIFANS